MRISRPRFVNNAVRADTLLNTVTGARIPRLSTICAVCISRTRRDEVLIFDSSVYLTHCAVKVVDRIHCDDTTSVLRERDLSSGGRDPITWRDGIEPRKSLAPEGRDGGG